MSLKRKLVGEIKIKATSGDVFYDIYKNRPNELPSYSPLMVQSVELKRGVFSKPGAIRLWYFTLEDGQKTSLMSENEEVDDEKMLVRHKLIEGELLSQYKSFEFIAQVIPINEESSLVEWTLDYEKMHPGSPEPSAMMDVLVIIAKDIDNHSDAIKTKQ